MFYMHIFTNNIPFICMFVYINVEFIHETQILCVYINISFYAYSSISIDLFIPYLATDFIYTFLLCLYFKIKRKWRII